MNVKKEFCCSDSPRTSNCGSSGGEGCWEIPKWTLREPKAVRMSAPWQKVPARVCFHGTDFQVFAPVTSGCTAWDDCPRHIYPHLLSPYRRPAPSSTWGTNTGAKPTSRHPRCRVKDIWVPSFTKKLSGECEFRNLVLTFLQDANRNLECRKTSILEIRLSISVLSQKETQWPCGRVPSLWMQ